MPRAFPFALALLALTLAGPVLRAHAQSQNDPYSIMVPEPGHHPPQPKPEPWLPPKYESPRGTKRHITRPRRARPPSPPRAAQVPPPIVAPETGRVLPNLPTLSPSGPHGTESFQDRAARCANQAGMYGDATGNRSSYINNCINQ